MLHDHARVRHRCSNPIKKTHQKSSVTAEGVQSGGGRQRSVYKGVTDFETAPLSSLPPSAACETSSLRSTGNLVFVCIYTVPFSDSFNTLDVLLGSSLSMGNFFSQTSKSCYYQRRRISAVRKYLFTKATVKLNAISLILSHLDHRNFLLSGLLLLSKAFVAFRTVLFALY